MVNSPADEALVDDLAAAMFAAQPGGPNWESLMTWATGSVATALPGTVGYQSSRARGEKPFEEARAIVERWRTTARAVLAHMREKGMLKEPVE